MDTFTIQIGTMEKETFEIHLPLFEGPFDLLLFFIERDELDIRAGQDHRGAVAADDVAVEREPAWQLGDVKAAGNEESDHRNGECRQREANPPAGRPEGTRR